MSSPPTSDSPPSEVFEDAVFESLWTQVLAAWGDEKVHDAFLSYAVHARVLHEAAGRYKEWISDVDRGAFARKRMDAIVLAATHLLYSTKTPPRTKVPLQITLSAFAVCAILLGWLVYAVFRR